MCLWEEVGQGMEPNNSSAQKFKSAKRCDRTKFDSLKEVNLSVEFCASQDCSIYSADKEFPSIVVDLPLLEKADYFQVAGTVKRFAARFFVFFFNKE